MLTGRATCAKHMRSTTTSRAALLKHGLTPNNDALNTKVVLLHCDTLRVATSRRPAVEKPNDYVKPKNLQ